MNERVAAGILRYLEEDLRDYPYALQIVEEEMNTFDFKKKKELLDEVLIGLALEDKIIIGEYMGPDEVKPWFQDITENITEFKKRMSTFTSMEKVDFIWIGLPTQHFRGLI